MEANLRWTAGTAIAPIAWGSTYYVTHQFLPAGEPLWGALFRALPAGFVLLAVRRRLPHGAWWWRSAVLGVLNVAAFFTLIYLSAQLLPTSVAATIMASSPVALMLLAWALLAERPAPLHLVGAGIGIAGVALMLLTAAAGVDPWGVLTSVAAMVMSSVGFVLTKRWLEPEADVLSVTSWQLTAGGLLLLPFALAFEGAPPAMDGAALWGFGYVTLIATALAFAAWFAGLRRLPAGTVGLVGLLNPVTGVLLGTVIAGEALTGRQLAGLTLVVVGILLGQPALSRIWARLRASGSARIPADDRPRTLARTP